DGDRPARTAYPRRREDHPALRVGAEGKALSMKSPLSPDALKERLAKFPTISLAYLPTLLEPCPRLSAKLGGPDILVKRDDLTGLAFGGNKVRQLEYVFGAVLESGADTIVAGAYTQSNWCRQITAAARRHGLEVVLVLAHGRKGPELQGNLL